MKVTHERVIAIGKDALRVSAEFDHHDLAAIDRHNTQRVVVDHLVKMAKRHLEHRNGRSPYRRHALRKFWRRR